MYEILLHSSSTLDTKRSLSSLHKKTKESDRVCTRGR